MFETFRQDAARWIPPGDIGDPSALTTRRTLTLMRRYTPLRAMAWFRFAAWCRAREIPFLPGLIHRRLIRVYGLHIRPGSEIGGGLYIPHPVGTVLWARRIGANVSVIACATLAERDAEACPEIGDEAYIGSGARVLGGIRIGRGARIGANAVVIQDVPDDATAVGVPARVIKIAGKQVNTHEPPAA